MLSFNIMLNSDRAININIYIYMANTCELCISTNKAPCAILCYDFYMKRLFPLLVIAYWLYFTPESCSVNFYQVKHAITT